MYLDSELQLTLLTFVLWVEMEHTQRIKFYSGSKQFRQLFKPNTCELGLNSATEIAW